MIPRTTAEGGSLTEAVEPKSAIRSQIVRKRMLTSVLFLLSALPAVGFLYNELSVRYYRHLHPPPGKLYVVDGYNMHLYCEGSGTPTILLEAGQGDDWTEWGKVQSDLAKVTRTCSYDRSGLGWSDARPGNRDSAAIADELHALLAVSGELGALLLVGRSAGGLHVRVFLSKYPENVVGLVLVDASTPEQVEEFPARVRAGWDQLRRQLFWNRWRAALGITRLLRRCGTGGIGASLPWSPADDDCVPGEIETARREARDFCLSASEARQTGPFPRLPILILSQDTSLRIPGTPEAQQAETAVIWNKLQEGLKRLSPRSRRIIAQGSPHHIESHRSELLVREVSRMALQVRGHYPEATNWQSTTIE